MFRITLRTPEDRAAYLEAALEDGDTEVIATALGEIARAIGVGELARQSGVSRETIYKGFAPGGNPTLGDYHESRQSAGLAAHGRGRLMIGERRCSRC